MLTAQHCAETFATRPDEVYFGVDPKAGENEDADFVAIADVKLVHRIARYERIRGALLYRDLAIVELSDDAPIEPVAINSGALDGALVGGPQLSVGFSPGRNPFDPIEGREFGVKSAVRHALDSFTSETIYSATDQLCSGDSGGPNFLEVDGEPVQIGVTSYGGSRCRTNVSMRVDAFLPWIAATMASYGDEPVPIDAPAQLRRNEPPRPWPAHGDEQPFVVPGSEGLSPGKSSSTLVVSEEGDVERVDLVVELSHPATPLVEISLEHAGEREKISAPFELLSRPTPLHRVIPAFDGFEGLPKSGEWTLSVSSKWPDTGSVTSWGISFVENGDRSVEEP